jgi:drug/metabolite transporter (DMT)-like permease
MLPNAAQNIYARLGEQCAMIKKGEGGVRLRGFLSLSATACFFGLGVVLAKLLTGVFSPVLLACLALGCGGLLVTLLLLVTRRPLLPPASWAIWGNLLVLGVLGTALPLVLVIAGFSMTSAVVGGVLIQAQGPAAVLLAAIILRERPSLAQLVGIAVIILGGVLVVVQPDLSFQADALGVALVLAGAVGYGFALIPAKRLAGKVDTLQVSALRFLIGVIFVAPLLYFQPTLMTGSVSWTTVATFALYVLTSYCAGYILQQDGLRFLKAWEAAATLQTLPVFAALFAVLFLHETVAPLQIAGVLAVIVGGIIIARGGSGA